MHQGGTPAVAGHVGAVAAARASAVAVPVPRVSVALQQLAPRGGPALRDGPVLRLGLALWHGHRLVHPGSPAGSTVAAVSGTAGAASCTERFTCAGESAGAAQSR